MGIRKRAPLWEQALLWALVGLLMGVIWHFSAQPGTVSSGTSGRFSRWLTELFFKDPTDGQYLFFEKLIRKIAHMAEFAMLMLGISHGLGQASVPHPDLWALAAVLLWGATDEIHQYFVPGRACLLKDVCVDLTGALMGGVLRNILNALYRGSPAKRKRSVRTDSVIHK